MRFLPSTKPNASMQGVLGGDKDPIVFTFVGQEILVAQSPNGPLPPRRSVIEAAGLAIDSAMVLGTLDGEVCLVAALDPSARDRVALASSEAGLKLRGLRSLFGFVDDAVFAAGGLAAQLAHFDETSKFCGRCGKELAWKPDERAKRCLSCDRDVYPHVSPCAIVLVADPARDSVLLTRQSRFPKGMYGLVAGFVEPGESLEECAAREVLEETGIVIGDVRYAGSQPWPFPSQLMVGFVATYRSGEIVVEEKELEEAKWFSRNAMPGLPPGVSIARRLIDEWLASPPR